MYKFASNLTLAYFSLQFFKIVKIMYYYYIIIIIIIKTIYNAHIVNG